SKLIGEPPPNYLTKAEIARQEEYARYVKQQEERQRQIEERRKVRNNKNIKNKNERPANKSQVKNQKNLSR
ncbi:MAG: hypothetical protein J6D52_06625, partial [Clostridia bacterium]|nr:hypothetical protein [Clostridia bacterium]